MESKRLTFPASSLDRRPPSLTLVATLLLLLCFLLLSSPLLDAQTSSARTSLPIRSLANASPEVVDAGPLPASEPLELTLHLAATDDQKAALDALLAAQIHPTSPAYHQWLTPAQFGQQFGATDDQLAALTAWATAQGLSISAVAPSRNRVTLTGTAGQLQSALAVDLHRVSLAGQLFHATVTAPSLPAEIAPLIAGISGLDDLPAPRPTTVASLTGTSLLADPLAALASLIDSNTSPVLTLSTATCSTDLLPSEVILYRDLLRQANAQGITVLATSACGTRGSGSFPASLPEATALTLKPSEAAVTGIATRPSWQVAPGLPADGMRQEPDLETSSVADFAQAVSAILTKAGARQGNINRNLYALAPIPGLYTHPTSIGSERLAKQPTPSLNSADLSSITSVQWEPSDGLGLVNLKQLIKAYASGAATTTTSVTSTSYSIHYGDSVTLTAAIAPSGTATTVPSGTVTFSTTAGTLGSVVISSNTAILTLASLPVGTNTVTATYSGDSAYAASSGTANVYVAMVNATVTATISPATNVPYGATATVTATVSIPNSNGISPNGTATAVLQGITGATYTGTLIPNASSNTATTNIPVAVPPPGTYAIAVTCVSTTNYACQSPVDLTVMSIKGMSAVTISVSPTAPLAGQTTSITATVANAGNGSGSYTFSGSVSFYDNGKLIATAAVATNQSTIAKVLAGNVTHSILAVYTGDTNWTGSTSAAAAVSPTLLPSTLNLSSNMGNVASVLAGADVVFTGTISTNVANTTGPTGTVTFYDTFNGSVIQLGSPSVTVPNGPNASIALFSTTGLLAGTHSIYAMYSGDDNFAPSTSPVLSIVVADYAISMVPSTLTLTGGTSANVTMLLNITGGFAGTVSFGCTPPAGSYATCSFTPASLSAGGVTTMTINTTALTTTTSSAAHAQLRRGGSWALGSTLSLASLLFFVMPRRRSPAIRLLIACVTVALLGASGCGAGTTATTATSTPAAPTSTTVGTPLGTMNFTITAAGSNGVNTSRHTYQYQVTVQ